MTGRSFIKSVALIAIAIFLLLATFVATFVYGSSVESRMFPVVRDGFVTILKEEPTGITMLAGGNKVRACEYIGSTALVKKQGTWMKADLVVEPRFINTTPNGHQTFGIYKVMDAGWESITFTARHRCHALWTTVSTWIDVDYKDIKHSPR